MNPLDLAFLGVLVALLVLVVLSWKGRRGLAGRPSCVRCGRPADMIERDRETGSWGPWCAACALGGDGPYSAHVETDEDGADGR